MVIPALLATALTACPQAPAPTPTAAPAPTQEQQVEARGLSTPKDMMLHGILAGSSFQSNQGFTLQNGSSVHANTGLILNSRNIVLNGGQVSSTSTDTCSDDSGMGFCLKGKPKFIAPIVVVPKADIPALKTKYSATPSITIQGNLNLNSSSEISTRFDNQIILVKGSVNLNVVATIKNATILVEETLSSNKGITLENTRIISKSIGLNQATKLSNSRIITDEDLTVNGTLESLGISSLISSKNITTNQTTSSTTGELAIIANQNITMNQSSSGKIAVWANGNVNLNQVSSLEGSVVAGGKVTLNQRVTLTKVLQHVNGDILGGGQFTFGSREEGVLKPGQVWRSTFGVNIASTPSITTDKSVFVKIEDPSTLAPFPRPVQIVGPLYRVGTPKPDIETIDEGRDGFNIYIPFPEGETAETVNYLVLAPAWYLGIQDSNMPPFIWTGRASLDPTGKYVVYSSQILLPETEALVFAFTKRTTTNIQGNPSAIQSARISGGSDFRVGCDNFNVPINCSQAVLDSVKQMALLHLDNFQTKLGMTAAEAPRLGIPNQFHILLGKDGEGTCIKSGAWYSEADLRIYICIDGSTPVTAGKYGDLDNIIRHETYHAVQAGFLTDNKRRFPMYNTIQGRSGVPDLYDCIKEGTARSIEKSNDVMKTQTPDQYKEIPDIIEPKAIPKQLISSIKTSGREPYWTQDFWVYVGNKLGKGIEYQANIFRSMNKTTYPFQPSKEVNDALIELGYKGGLQEAYWDWAKNQGIEKTILLHQWTNNQRCIPDVKTLERDYFYLDDRFAGKEIIFDMKEAEDVTKNYKQILNSKTFSGKRNIAVLETRVVRVLFKNAKDLTKPENQKLLSLKVTKSDGSPVDPSIIKYKWYLNQPPKTTPTGCGLLEGSELQYRPSKTLPSDPEPEIIVLISNVNIDAKNSAERFNLEEVQVSVQRIEPMIAPTPPIKLIGNVGDTLTQNITIANTGDMDSTLSFKQYFISSKEISVPPPFFDTNQPSPQPGAAARAQGIPLRAYPDDGTLTPAIGNFLSPRVTSSEIMLSKTSATPAPSRDVEVSYKCLTTGVFPGFVNIVYRTGATDDLGDPIEEKVAVSVEVTCLNPATPSNGNGLGGSGGEPWLRSFDGNIFGFHGVGEFILAQNSSSGMNVQVRYVKGAETEFDGNTQRQVSFNGAIAMQVGSDRIGVYAQKGLVPCCGFGSETFAQVRLNGQIIAPPQGNAHNYAQVLPGGGILSWFDYWITIISPDRQEITQVRLFEGHVGSVSVIVPKERAGEYRGLLGDFDRNANNDYQSRNGTSYTPPLSTSQLYLEWGESWRIDQFESLFDYEPGQYSSNFTDRSFPTNTVTIDDLSPQARTLGESACNAAGVVDPRAFKACVLDVGLTGNRGWASVAKGLDPGSQRLLVAPLNTSVIVGERVRLSADVFGDLANQNLIWNSNGGRVEMTSSDAKQVEFVAPMQAGVYTVEVRSAANPSLTGSIVVTVNQMVAPIIQRLAVGDSFNVLLNANGTVSTWGLEITDYSYARNCSSRANPLVLGADQIQSVSAGSNYVVALRQGQIMAWGGLSAAVPGSSSAPIAPTLISPSSDWVGVSAASISGFSDSLVSIKRNGTAWVWLRVYLGSYAYVLKPFLISGVSDVIGLSGNLLLKRDGTVWTTVVTGNEGAYAVQAKQINGLDRVVQLASSGDASRQNAGHHLALKSDGSVWAWGNNSYGQLGLGFASSYEAQPQQVMGIVNAAQIRVARENSFVITSNGELWLWGQNTRGFPTDALNPLLSPVRLGALGSVVDIQGFQNHLTVVKSNRALQGWGDNYFQQVNCSPERTVLLPSLIPGLTW